MSQKNLDPKTNKYTCSDCGSVVGWADPTCSFCRGKFAEKANTEATTAAEQQAREYLAQQRTKRKQELEDNPFDPRAEVSADAQHIARRIVRHLWIIFVVLPVCGAVLYAVIYVAAH